MPGPRLGSRPNMTASSSAADQEAIAYIRSLSVNEVRGIVRMMDNMMHVSEPSVITDDDMEEYRADMIRDIANGPLTGGGAGILQSFARSNISRWAGPERNAATPRTAPTIRRPAATSSLDYSRFEEIDSEEDSTDQESDGSAVRYNYNRIPGWAVDETTTDVTEDEAKEQALNMIRNATTNELRFLSPEGPDLDRTDEEMERLRTLMIRSMTTGEASDSSDDQRARALAAQARERKMTKDDTVFLETDPAKFRRQILSAKKNHPVPPRFVTADEIRTESRKIVTELFEDYYQLGGILERHEATIQKRWAKKTRSQRLKVLLTAWPGMIFKHRPDLHAARKAVRDERVVYSKSDRDAYMWPHINQEDLLKPKVLPIFLNARGRNPPCTFWEFDIDSVNLAERLGCLDEAFLNRHNMLFRNRNTPETYGELLEIQSDEEAFEVMKDRSLPPGAGLTTLIIQQKVLRFLVDCCREILHEIPPAELLNSAILPEPSLKETSTQAVTSLADMSLEAPYGVPDGLDLPALQAIFAAKRSAAEDHIWALREDPSYFVDTLRDAMDHRYEQVKDVDGSPHPNMRNGREGLIWGSVVSNAVASAEWNLEMWTKLCEISGDVEKGLAEYGGKVPKGELPEKLKFDLSYLKTTLEHTLRGPLAQLTGSFYSSPPMRPYAERVEEDTARSRKTGVFEELSLKIGPNVKKIFDTPGTPESELLWLIDILTSTNRRGDLCAEQWGISTIVDELGRLIQNESRVKALISSRVAEIISDLGVMAESLRQMIAYAGQIYQFPIIPLTDDKGKKMAGVVPPYYNILSDIEGSKPQEFFKLCIPPTDGRFYYPSDKRRSRENHEAMRQAERNLDAFWMKVDANLEVKRQWHLDHLKTCKSCCDCGVDSAMWKMLRQPRYVQRLGEWVEQGGVPSEHEKQQRKVDDAARRPLSEVYFDLERRTERTVAKGHSHSHKHSHHHHDHRHDGHHHGGQAKTKTRGTPAPEKENIPPPVALPPSEQKDEQPVFEVDARAHKVFKTIFFNPSISSTPGEVPWLDFVHAMTATGFQAEKLYGSVWQFKPTKLDVERAILIHEPHPSGKIPYRICRNHGRRLNRAYGWTGDNFVLAGKAA